MPHQTSAVDVAIGYLLEVAAELRAKADVNLPINPQMSYGLAQKIDSARETLARTINKAVKILEYGE